MKKADAERPKKSNIGIRPVGKRRDASGGKTRRVMRSLWTRIGVAAVVLTAACILGCGQQRESRSFGDREPKIGALIALTGYGSSFGENEANVMKMLRDKYPKATFFVEDSKSDPRQAVSAAQKLLDIDCVDILYCDLTTVANAVAPMTKDSGAILIAAVYLADLLDRNPLAIRNLPRGRDEARLLLNHLIQTAQTESPSSLILLGSNDEFGRGSVEDCHAVAKELHINVIGSDTIPEDSTALASFAAALTKQNPTAIYMASLSPTLGTLVRQLRISGYAGKILTTDAFAYPYIKDAAGEYASGTVYVDFPSTERSATFAQDYSSRFKSALNPAGVLLHDGLSILLDAYYEKHPRAAADLVAELEGRHFEGIYGNVAVRGREILYPLEIKKAD